MTCDKKLKKWSEREEAYLRLFYPVSGAHYCAEKLGRSYDSITNKVRVLGLKRQKVDGVDMHRIGDKKPLVIEAPAHKPLIVKPAEAPVTPEPCESKPGIIRRFWYWFW